MKGTDVNIRNSFFLVNSREVLPVEFVPGPTHFSGNLIYRELSHAHSESALPLFRFALVSETL